MKDFAEVHKVLKDAWMAHMSNGVTRRRKDAWANWSIGYTYALFIDGLIDMDTERKVLIYIAQGRE